MRWWDRPAPVEPSAAERGVTEKPAPTTYYSSGRCAACHTRGTLLEVIRAGEYEVEACVDGEACRDRATAAEIYGAPSGYERSRR